MKKNLIKLLCLLFSFCAAFMATSVSFAIDDTPQVCLLSSVKNISNEGRIVFSATREQKVKNFFPHASLEEIQSCLFSDHYKVVIWIMHGTDAPSEAEQTYSFYSLPSVFARNNKGIVQKIRLPQFVFQKWLDKNPSPKNLKKLIIAGCGMDLQAGPVSDKATTIYYHSALGILLHSFIQNGVQVEVPEPTIASSIETFLEGTPTVQLTEDWLTEKLAEAYSL